MTYRTNQLVHLLGIEDVQERRQVFYDSIIQYFRYTIQNKIPINIKKYMENLSSRFPQSMLKFNYVKHLQFVLTQWENGYLEQIQLKINYMQKIKDILCEVKKWEKK